MTMDAATYSFADKVAIVTGATSGIGKATAQALARAGARVVVSGINEALGSRVVEEITRDDGTAVFIRADVSRREDVEHLVSETVRQFGRLDIAFNNAGIEGDTALTADWTEECWLHVLDVNLTGVWRCMKAEIPAMLSNGGGVIVNCSSVAGLVGFAGSAAYVASKHGIIGLTRTAALEYAPMGIRISAFCPGGIDTPRVRRVIHEDPDQARQILGLERIGRMGTSEEIAAAVLWLCSGAATFVIGHPLVVDGGLVAR